MRSLIASLCIILGLSFGTELAFAKRQSFIDKVYKVQNLKGKYYISFHREPVLYEVEEKNTSILTKLEQSQKQKKPVAVTVDPLSKKILEVKGP
jgi:nicotinic acid phosphoribosyltransferase